jgi:N-sulfoglucosamine sulfohydrolase
VAAQSRQFFNEAKKSGQPFFYYVNYFDPHGPYTTRVSQVDDIPEKPLQAKDIEEPFPLAKTPEAARQATAIFYNTILRVDVGMGLLLDELEAAGLAENTLVVFLGDNGAEGRHGKTTSYEPGVQVPLIIRRPGKAGAGQVRSELVSAIDIMPTLLATAGVSVPPEVAGCSLTPLLDCGSPEWRRYLFTEMNFHAPNQFWPQRTVRDNRYKLLLNFAPQVRGVPVELFHQAPVELFDLLNDPEETRNVADQPEMAATRRRLEAALRQWQEQTDDPLADPARLERWRQVAEEWKKSAPRLENSAYPDIAIVPPGGLELLK